MKKIRSPQILRRILSKKRKKKGFKIVFTNGCFDLIHKGHVTYLKQARKLGSCLVVALNSDESVQRLKGPQRPLNSLDDRLIVAAALESVDYVTWFGEDTPLELIQFLQPDVLVKGGDWKPEQIVGSDFVLSRGGKVRALPYVKGQSTTLIVQKICSC